MDELNIGKVTQVKGTTVKAKINHELTTNLHIFTMEKYFVAYL